MWDAKESVEAYFQRITLCAELAHDAAQVDDYTNKQLIQVMFVQMQCIEQFRQANQEWKRKPTINQTIAYVCTHYVDTYKELLKDIDNKEEKEKHKATVRNVITLEIIQQMLDVQEKADKVEEPKPTTQFASMVQLNEKLLEQLTKLTEKVKNLESNSNKRSTNINNNGNNNRNNNGKMAWRK